MVEIAQNIRYAEEIHGPTQLSEAIQRSLKLNRATDEIARYLARHEDRFFGAIVVAALGGDPKWHAVSLEEDPRFELLGERLTDAFGVLTFDGTENYYALDGQHRLAAIRNLLDNTTDFRPPKHFRDEEVSVLIVTPQQLEDTTEFIVRYRRLFGHLNRYAKSMSRYDSIIMDEDDALAIVTRRLVAEHPFFRSASDSEFESGRILMEPGKNLRPGLSFFSTLEVLYDLNVGLLSSRHRRNGGWGIEHENLTVYRRFRPPDEEIDALEAELITYWNALIEILPILHEDGRQMRDHRPPEHRDDPDASQDCVLFWPVVQVMLADLARALLDDALLPESGPEGSMTEEQACEALFPLRTVSWDAHHPPWKYVMLVPTDDAGTSWRIANEGRKQRMQLMERVVRWQCGVDPLTEEEISGEGGLRGLWHIYIPASAASESKKLWSEIEAGVVA